MSHRADARPSPHDVVGRSTGDHSSRVSVLVRILSQLSGASPVIWGHTRESVQSRTSAWRKRSAARSVRRSLAPGPAPTKQTGWLNCWLESEALVVAASTTTDPVLPEPSAWHSLTGRCEDLPHRRVAELQRKRIDSGPSIQTAQAVADQINTAERTGGRLFRFTPQRNRQSAEQTEPDSRLIRRGGWVKNSASA